MALLTIENLALLIGEMPILRDIDLTVSAGEVVGIVGESGSGKSMTALTVMRLLPRAAVATGRVVFDGIDILAAPETAMVKLRGDDIGMVFQEPMTALNPVKTIGEQIAEGVRFHTGANRADAEARARSMLDRVGLPAPRFGLDRFPHELSGGQRQRVVIAIACALNPKLLIADEPTTALDVVLQAQILDLLQDLVDERRMGLMLISHDLAVVAGMADRIVVMRDGAVQDAGAAVPLLRERRHPYTRLLAEASTHVPARRATGPFPALAGALSAKSTEGGEDGRDRTPTPSPSPQGGGEHAPAGATSISNGVSEVSTRGDTSVPPSPLRGGVGGGGKSHLPDNAVRDRTRHPLLAIRNLTRIYPGRREGWLGRRAVVTAVDDVSLDIARGEMVALVGRSGCGKSTLARAILALDHPTSGSIRLEGEEIAGRHDRELRAARRHMQVVFQDPYGSFNPRMRVEKLVAEPLHLLDRAPTASERRDRVAHALHRVGLQAADMAKYPHEFSGGQRQRIAIARAIVTEPKLIVADEPVSALDVSIRAQILDLFVDLNLDLGLACLFITHDLHVARAVTDRVLVMSDGRIVEEGQTGAVLDNPQSDAAKELVAAAPDLERALASRLP